MCDGIETLEGFLNPDPLSCFYAVTDNGSVYMALNAYNELGDVVVTKVKTRNDARNLKPLTLRGGSFVGITYDFGLIMMPNRDGAALNLHRLGGHTSSVIALFLTRDEAEECLVVDEKGIWDDRWKPQTQEVLDSIGWHHPRFAIAPSLARRLERPA